MGVPFGITSYPYIGHHQTMLGGRFVRVVVLEPSLGGGRESLFYKFSFYSFFI